ncbi:MAG: M1 family aminopeptidase [Candidatus Heimdallarchaeaceae archaeon]
MDKNNVLFFKKNNFSTGKHRKYKPSLQLEPIHQNIKLSFDVPNETITGTVGTIVKANVKGVNRIVLDAIDFDISHITGVDSWEYDGKNITINWDNFFEKDERREIIVEYIVQQPISGLYFSYPDNEYPNRPIYVVADHETQRASYWLPCIDHTSVRCTIDFELTSDISHTILANGQLLLEKENDDGSKTAHWKLEHPCPAYLLTIAVGEFIEYKDRDVDAGKGLIPLRYYTTQNYVPEDLKRAFDRTPAMLEWLSKKFKTPIEWSKYYQVATARHGGAMENISFVTWNDFAVLNETKYKESWWIVDSVNIHEMSHSLFGDHVVCDEFSHTWLKESWAVYTESIYLEDTRGKEEALYDMYNNATRYMKESDTKYARPIVTNVYDSSWDMFDAHLYPGGAWRIHMLRKTIGDERFFDAVADYLQTYKSKTVRTIDFQRKLEQHSGLDLEEFFDQWLYSSGYPKLKAEFTFDDSTKLCKLKIKQTQEDEKKNIGLFKFPLEVKIEEHDGSFKVERFDIVEKEHNFYVKTEKKPKLIQLDPDYKQLFSLEFNPGDDLLIRQLRIGNVIGRIQAIKELAKTGKRKNILTLKDHYLKESYWGVKIELAKALAKSPNFLAVEMLVELMAKETDPLVLPSFLRALDNLRYAIVFDSAKKFLERDEVLYNSQANALELIGSQRTKEAFNFLSKYEIKEDFQSIVLRGKYSGIGKTRTEEALDYLLDKLTYGNAPEKARGAVVNGIVECLSWMDKHVRERTVSRIIEVIQKERYEETIFSFARSLATLKETSTISLFQGLKAKIAYQDHPMIDRWIKEIEKGETTEEEIKKIRKEQDEMKLDVKKLFSRVEELEARRRDEDK